MSQHALFRRRVRYALLYRPNEMSQCFLSALRWSLSPWRRPQSNMRKKHPVLLLLLKLSSTG